MAAGGPWRREGLSMRAISNSGKTTLSNQAVGRNPRQRVLPIPGRQDGSPAARATRPREFHYGLRGNSRGGERLPGGSPFWQYTGSVQALTLCSLTRVPVRSADRGGNAVLNT